MFRYSRAQRGRYREFWQIGFEAIGSDDPAVDAELIAAFRAISQDVHTVPLRLEINSIGDKRCRPAYIKQLRGYLRARQSKLDPDSRDRLLRNPLRVFDTKDEGTKEILRDAPKITDHLCAECEEHFRSVRAYLRALNIRPQIVPELVRGLDYYTRTVFEFQNYRLGSQSSVCAGGRYDQLVQELGGRPTPAVGWASGIERIALSIPDKRAPERNRLDVFFVFEDPSRRREIFQELWFMRDRWICDMAYGNRSIKRQFSDAARREPRVIGVVRESDVVLRGGNLKRPVTVLDLEDLEAELARRLD
jgi:histidyl-tRNA synthetase